MTTNQFDIARQQRGAISAAQAGIIVVLLLVIAGGEDPGTTPAMNKAIADAIPGAAYVELASAAHFCNMQAVDAFNSALTNFLATQKARMA